MKNLNKLKSKILKDCADILKNNIAKEIIKVEQKHIKSDVYDKYTTNSNSKYRYKRRYGNKGLLDPNNIKTTMYKGENSAKLTVSNITKVYPYISKYGVKTKSKNVGKYLTPLIEKGGVNSYDFAKPYGISHNKYSYVKPRTFLQNTKKDISKEELINLLRKGMKGGI